MPRPIVLVSNRGPVSFTAEDGGLRARRGAGGLVSGLGPLVAGTDTRWLAVAMSEGDRLAADEGVVEAEGFTVRMMTFDDTDYRLYYDVVCNQTLWFLHHGLWDAPRQPRFDERWFRSWEAFRRVNASIGATVAESAPADAVVLLQDYHLSLVAPEVRTRREDIRCVHFSHTPFAGGEAIRALPGEPARELLEGLAANHACGFHCRRWAADFEAAAAVVGVDAPTTFVAPLASDPDDLAGTARSEATAGEADALEAEVGDRSFIVRVDRIELSKNLLRGFHAYDALLETRPDLRERVVFGAFVYPSREGLAEYLAYRQEVEGLVRHLNGKWATETWTPILFDPSDNYPRSIAALQRADVLLVNPIKDGLNLVAKEGPMVNRRDAGLVLSTEAGSWDELAEGVEGVNPYDIRGTARALATALDRPPEERARRAAHLRSLAGSRTPRDWLDDLVEVAG